MTDKEKTDTMTIGEITNLRMDFDKEIDKALDKFYEATGLWIDEIIVTNYEQRDGPFKPIFRAKIKNAI